MKFGIEIETFIVGPNGVGIPPETAPRDSEGLQVEARGLPYEDIFQAVYSAKADLEKILFIHQIHPLLSHPYIKLTKELKRARRRIASKSPVTYQNIYGYQDPKTSDNIATAGIHLSMTNPIIVKTEYGERTIYQNFDYVQIIRHLDKYFKEWIKSGRRKPGFYEVKSDGRIEYRSLPNNIDLLELAEVIYTFFNNNGWEKI